VHRGFSERACLAAFLTLLAFSGVLCADKLSFDERMDITRGLMAEFAKSKVTLPRAKKPLVFHSNGKYDRKKWQEDLLDNGAAARVGDQVQITRVLIEDKKIIFEINGGLKTGRHWYDHVEVGMGPNLSPVNTGQNESPTAGSTIALEFPGSVPSLTVNDIKQMLGPLFDFSKHSATQNYVESLPAPIQKAIKEQHAIEGMNPEQVMLAMGHPKRKTREDKDGEEVEDWIYGEPPGKITFVRFSEGKVVRVHDDYANIGGYTAPPLPQR
jgi:hypothetical protein